VTRTTRRLSLTVAGRDYLEVCRRVLDELDAAESRIAGRDDDLSGELVLTAPVVFGRLYLLPLLVRFLGMHPRLDARLMLSDRVVDLAEEGIDVALRIAALPDSALIAVKVGTQRLVTCAAPAYLRKHGAPKTPADLAGLDCIAFANLPREGYWMFKSAAHGRRGVRVRPRLSVNTAEAAVDAAVAGLGVTRLLSYQAAEALGRKRLVTVLDSFDDTEIPVHLVHRAVRLPRPQVRLFIDFAARELRARLRKTLPKV
jgi:DNA-binding transcriptional LysR family regulator